MMARVSKGKKTDFYFSERILTDENEKKTENFPICHGQSTCKNVCT